MSLPSKNERTKIQVGKINRTDPILGNSSTQETSQTTLSIDPDSIFAQKTLYELCDSHFSLRYGKKKRKKKDLAKQCDDSTDEVILKVSTSSSDVASKPENAVAVNMSTGPMVEIINGKIVVKQSSLVLNPSNPLIYDDYEEVIEDNYPTATYSSFLKRPPSLPWTTEETKLFYQALRQCGLDFTMMQLAFFPNKTRKQLKSKFFREEKNQPDLMNCALHTSLPLEVSLFDECSLTDAAGLMCHNPNLKLLDEVTADKQQQRLSLVSQLAASSQDTTKITPNSLDENISDEAEAETESLKKYSFEGVTEIKNQQQT